MQHIKERTNMSKVKIDINELHPIDQLKIKNDLMKFKPGFISEKLLIVTFNQEVEDILYNYGLHNYEEYK
jgi:hypothetical protein